MLEVKEQVAYHWMRIGLLAVTAFREHGRIVSRVHAKDVEEFQRLYVLGRDLAREFHVSPRWLARELRKAGVRQVSGPGVDDGRQILYDRVAIARPESLNRQSTLILRHSLGAVERGSLALTARGQCLSERHGVEHAPAARPTDVAPPKSTEK